MPHVQATSVWGLFGFGLILLTRMVSASSNSVVVPSVNRKTIVDWIRQETDLSKIENLSAFNQFIDATVEQLYKGFKKQSVLTLGKFLAHEKSRRWLNKRVKLKNAKAEAVPSADRKAIVDWIRQQQQKENHLLGLEDPSDLDDKVEDTYNCFKGDSCFPKKAKVRVT